MTIIQTADNLLQHFLHHTPPQEHTVETAIPQQVLAALRGDDTRNAKFGAVGEDVLPF